MAHDFDIIPYLPDASEITQEQIDDVQTRLRVMSLDSFPDVKTTANSPFGNLFINPASLLIAQHEVAMGRFQDDLILENLANGSKVTNCDFVREFLSNFGVSSDTGVPVIGIVRLSFQENKSYVLDRGSQILFGDSGLFHFITTELGDILIDPVSSVPRPGNWHALSQVGPSEFVVNLTVTGAPGVLVESGQTAQTDIPDEELISITATDDFDTGRMPEDIPSLAQMALDISYAATFSSRGGSVAFIKRKLPNIVGVSAVQSGDIEMQRDKSSTLITSTGKMDVMVKGSAELLKDSAILTLSKAFSGRLVGALELPGGVPVYIDSINVVATDQTVDGFVVHGTAKNPNKAKFASGAFSELEILGLEVDSTTIPTAGSTFVINKNSLPAEYPKIDVGSSGGIYRGHLFTDRQERNLKMNANGIVTIDGTTYGSLRIEDTLSGEVVDQVLVRDDGATGIIDLSINDVQVEKFLNGITIRFETVNGDFILNGPNDFNGEEFEIFFRANTAQVKVNYRYDPAIQMVTDFLKGPEVQPVVDVLAKGFNTAFIDKFTVLYRRTQGNTVAKQQIKNEIFNYLNSLTFPDIFEEAQIADIVLFGGAVGLEAIEFNGTLFHSLASKYSLDGSENVLETRDLEPSNMFRFNDLYEEPDLYSVVGLRNVHYILDLENIELKEVQ